MPLIPSTDPGEPTVHFIGGADTLQLEAGGKVYRPGDPMPKSLSQQTRLALQGNGIRFETRHPEPAVVAVQIVEPAAAPAVETAQPSPSAAKKGE